MTYCDSKKGLIVMRDREKNQFPGQRRVVHVCCSCIHHMLPFIFPPLPCFHIIACPELSSNPCLGLYCATWFLVNLDFPTLGVQVEYVLILRALSLSFCRVASRSRNIGGINFMSVIAKATSIGRSKSIFSPKTRKLELRGNGHRHHYAREKRSSDILRLYSPLMFIKHHDAKRAAVLIMCGGGALHVKYKPAYVYVCSCICDAVIRSAHFPHQDPTLKCTEDLVYVNIGNLQSLAFDWM